MLSAMGRDGGIVLESPYYVIEVVASGRVIKITRKAHPFESQEAVDQACNPVQDALDRLGRTTHVLLIDTREAVGRNDPEYERWFEYHRRKMLVGFPAVALLVKTVVGKMHVDRLLEQDDARRTVRVFTDEGLAIDYLWSVR